MPYLGITVILVGAVGLLNLVLVLGVIARLRAQAEQLRVALGGQSEALPAAGTVIGEFDALTTCNLRVSRDTFQEPTSVGFFSPSCTPCREAIPAFMEHAALIGRQRTLAVVVGVNGVENNNLATTLATAARVVVELPNGELSAAFGAVNVPALYVIGPGGQVITAGHTTDALTSLVPA